MKRGIVFIGWSGTNELAKKVEQKITGDGTYVCTVGGNHQPLRNSLYVGDTILTQLQKSNQAIFLIEKKADGHISNNLMFELGFALSKFNATSNKIHLYYIDIEENDPQIPSDLHGAWATFLFRKNESDDEIVEKIYSEFLRKQQIEVPENKMGIINTWYKINHEIETHSTNPNYSDYEFAIYLLFYTQAASMFDVVPDAKKRLEALLREVNPKSVELYNTVTLCLTSLDFFTSISGNPNQRYLTDDVFMNVSERYQDAFDTIDKYFTYDNPLTSEIEHDETELTKWTYAIGKEHYAYACLLYSKNPDLSFDEIKDVCNDATDSGLLSIKYCNELISINTASNVELATLLKAYIYRNFAIMYEDTGINDELRDEYYHKSLNERKQLLFYYKYPDLDARLLKNFTMEYYLSIAEVTPILSDLREIRANVRGLNKYIKNEIEEWEKNSYYFTRIKQRLDIVKEKHSEISL